VEAVQQLVALVLVQLAMAGRMKGHGPTTTTVAPDAQRDLLCHRARRQEHRGLLAEQLRHAMLETFDPLARSVHVGLLVVARRLGDRSQAARFRA
jgi:hypothetical protein